MSIRVAGQYWQSVKAYSGSVGLSFLAAQRRDCEETDAVNALASLSVGVLSNKRYGIPRHAHTYIHTHHHAMTQKQKHTLSRFMEALTRTVHHSHLFCPVSSSLPDEPMEHDSDSM